MQFRDPTPGGRTAIEQGRNATLLSGYDYTKSAAGITGYAGQDLQRVVRLDRTHAAVRTRVGPRGNYKAGMALCDDGRLVLAVCRRDDDYRGPFAIVVYESNDLGLSWQEIAVAGINGKEPSLTFVADGAILMTVQDADFSPDHKNAGVLIARSTDGGHNWTLCEPLGFGYPRNVILNNDGTVLFLAETDSPDQLRLCRSRDHGVTWSDNIHEITWPPDMRAQFDEISALRLDDGRLLAALRHCLPPVFGDDELSQSARGHAFADTVLIESSDDGMSWSQPRQLTAIGEVHVELSKLRDGRLLATYVNYHLPYGVHAIFSEDNGATWDIDHPFQLSCSVFGPCNNGWPVTVQLADGSLLTAYAANAFPNDGPPSMVCEVVRWTPPAR